MIVEVSLTIYEENNLFLNAAEGTETAVYRQ